MGGGQKVEVIVSAGTGCMVSVREGEGIGLGESGSSGTGCVVSVKVDEGMGLGKSDSSRFGCAVSVNVDEGMGVSEAGVSVATGKQPTSIADKNNGIRIVIRFMGYSL